MASVAAVGEVSSSPPLSTSVPPPRSCTYHVFLSFRGQDTRKGFTDHLYASLERKGIKTFRDDKDLERGEVISDELLKAIEESMFAITVLSPNYASSTWCLAELQKIVECSKNLGLFVVPVFYGVQPSDVRHQTGNFEEAFKKHEERFGQESEEVKGWRDALTQVASYSGWDSKSQHEATLVESIAQHIHKKLIPKLPSFIENLVGIVSRVEEVIKHIGIRLNDVRFVGIWGMGGMGKTTIARAIYEAIQGEFEASCFLANIRETCERSCIVQIQKELVARMNISANTVYDEYEGRRIIRNSLCRKKVLLVLDDVSKEVQLKNLARDHGWFGAGSRIIITTRDIQLLKIQEVHGTYKVEGLVQNEAFDLFCLKAFKQQNPVEGYLDLSKEVVNYGGGLPLALEVLGSHLYRRPLNVWRSAIEKIKSTPCVEILDTLKISYEGLDIMEKNIFLDIACFFKGMEIDKITNILKKCGYYAEIGIAILVDRSLVTINQQNNVLDMHDLIQDMGRNLVLQESPNNPGKRSRLWCKNDIDQVLTNDMGTEAIQGIFPSSGYDACWSTEAFSKLSELKFLRLQNSYFKPLWHGNKFLEKLKYLDLSYSCHLKQTPDLTGVPNLETLDLSSCYDLTEVHPSLIHHKSLVLLNLSSCRSLETLPGKLEMSSLQELIIEYCYHFENPPEFGECMKKLSRLSLRYIPVRKLPTSLGCLVGLKDLDIKACGKLDRLPDTILELKSLKTLYAAWCWSLHRLPTPVAGLRFLETLDLSHCNLTDESFPHDFGHLTSLMDLDLSHNYFVRIPISIHELPKLRCLRLNGCAELQFLPELPSSIRQLEACRCDSLNISDSNILSKVCSVFKSHLAAKVMLRSCAW